MGTIQDLTSRPGIFARCPHCEGDFPLRSGHLFDATRKLPQYALAYLEQGHMDLKREREQLKERQRRAQIRPQLAAEVVRIGKVVEKIAPSLPGFSLEPSDCRALFEPIDYVAFKGLSKTGRVDAVLFVDVKSGQARLNAAQRQIRDLVEAGNVSLLIADTAQENSP